MNDPTFQWSRKTKILAQILGLLIGVAAGAFLVFQILFLSRVLPHGGF